MLQDVQRDLAAVLKVRRAPRARTRARHQPLRPAASPPAAAGLTPTRRPPLSAPCAAPQERDAARAEAAAVTAERDEAEERAAAAEEVSKQGAPSRATGLPAPRPLRAPSPPRRLR
jgi:hypothetical protein